MEANTITQLNDPLDPIRLELCDAYEKGEWQRALQLAKKIDERQLELWRAQERKKHADS